MVAGGSLRREAGVLFAGLWLLYGACINSRDLQAYTLQHAVVASLVERGTYELPGAHASRGRDLLLFDGHVLPNKQPGQFTLGAAAYWPLRLCGLTYAGNYLLTAALVTWLTASLLSALASAFVFLLITEVWRLRRADGLAAALTGGVATVLLPYSGIAHHDVIAGSYVAIALCLIERAIASKRDENWTRPVAAGVFLGLALFTSGLPAALVAGLVLYVVSTRRVVLIVRAVGGVLLGLLPLAAYNLHYFGSPFLQGYVAGGFDDTYPGLHPARLLHNLNVYFGTGDVSVLKYMPIALAAAAGLAITRGGRREHLALLLVLLLHVAYIASIPSIGACQYGPRFLIPAVPLAMLGLPALLAAGRKARSRVIPALVIAAAIWSFAVNLTGVLGGTMYCDTKTFAFPGTLRRILAEGPGPFPLLGLSLTLGILGTTALVMGRRRRRISRP